MKVGWTSNMWDYVWESISADQVMTLIEEGKLEDPPSVRVLILPDDVKLTELTGDDWDDTPASSNASGINAPRGHFVDFEVGKKIPDYVARALIRWSKEKGGER